MNILVTGVTAGFGKQIAIDLINKGHTVIGTGRRKQRLDELKQTLGDNFIPLCFDMQDTAAIDNALSELPADILNHLDALINNAGLALGLNPAQSADFHDWQTMINTNIIGLSYLTHKLLPIMVNNKQGTIINIGSIAGNYPYMGGNVYGATKAFVKQFSLNLRADLHGTGVRVSNIEPGLCGETEFSHVRFHGDDIKAAKVYENAQALNAKDIANTVIWVLEQPKHININRIEIMPTTQSFAGLNVYKGE